MTTRLRATDERLGETLNQILDGGAGYAIVEDVTLDNPELAMVQVARTAGRLLPQDVHGTMVWRVEHLSDEHAKSSKRSDPQQLHNDRAAGWLGLEIDALAMLCVRSSDDGGVSLLAPADEIREAMQREFPDLYDHLLKPFGFERSTGVYPGQSTVSQAAIFGEDRFGRYANIATPRNRAAEAHGWLLSPEERKALDALDELLHRPELQTRVHLQPGEMLVVNERRVLHGRTAFHSKDSQRLLLRVWLQRL